MDLRKMLSTVEFTESRRGADRNEVASFLRELARGVAALERQLADATARADKAEQRLREVGSDDEIRRTLVLAQRTADNALADATAEGQRLVTAAEQRSARLIAEAEAQAEQTRAAAEEAAERRRQEAEQQAAQMLADGEAEARRATEEMRTQLRQQVADLGDRRMALAEDVSRLEEHLAAQRRRMESAVSTLQFLLDNPEALAEISAPSLTTIDLTGLMEDPPALSGHDHDSQQPELAVSADVAPEPAASSEVAPAGDVSEPELVLDLTTEVPRPAERVAAGGESAADDEQGWNDTPVIDDSPLGYHEIEPITAEVPVIGDEAPTTIIIDARDDHFTGAVASRPNSAAAHDERRRRFGRSR